MKPIEQMLKDIEQEDLVLIELKRVERSYSAVAESLKDDSCTGFYQGSERRGIYKELKFGERKFSYENRTHRFTLTIDTERNNRNRVRISEKPNGTIHADATQYEILRRAGKNILCIDDNSSVKSVVDTYNELAEEEGRKVTFHYAPNGRVGLELVTRLESEKRSIDLINLDLDIPIMTGDQFLKELKRQRKEYPVIIKSLADDIKKRVKDTEYEHVTDHGGGVIFYEAALEQVGEVA